MTANGKNRSTAEAAPMKRRYGALLFDYLLILGYGAVLVVISIVFQPFFGRLFASDPTTSQLAGFLLMTLPVVLYFVFCESSAQMGTFGKRKFGIRVVDPSGERIGKTTALIRSVVKFLPWEMAHFAIWRLYFPADYSEATILFWLTMANVLGVVYFLFPLTNKQRKAIHDWAASTQVIVK